jgi:tRNA pseudouridine55 synthase
MTGETPAAPGRTGPWRDVDGVLLLDKPEGVTSNAALQRVRRAFRARKAGHTGSLDPLASGLLPICLGQATKASGLLLDADKTYQVRIELGVRTTTGDREGEPLEMRPVPTLGRDAVRSVATGFLGKSTQVPPMYSALKHKGERLYRLARRGIEVERPPRRIEIKRLDVVAIVGSAVELEVVCSKGTYVRSLAEDLADALGTVGHVARLRRLALGPFDGIAMKSLELVESSAERPADLDAMLLPVDASLSHLPAVRLGAGDDSPILQGQAVFAAGPGAARVRMYGADGRFLGLGRMSPDGRRLAPERIMVDLVAGPAACA